MALGSHGQPQTPPGLLPNALEPLRDLRVPPTGHSLSRLPASGRAVPQTMCSELPASGVPSGSRRPRACLPRSGDVILSQDLATRQARSAPVRT